AQTSGKVGGESDLFHRQGRGHRDKRAGSARTTTAGVDLDAVVGHCHCGCRLVQPQGPRRKWTHEFKGKLLGSVSQAERLPVERVAVESLRPLLRGFEECVPIAKLCER